MANRWRGEVGLVVDGQHQRMRLTLGALAELEADLAEASFMALVQRFEGGVFSTRDVLALLCAGLRGEVSRWTLMPWGQRKSGVGRCRRRRQRQSFWRGRLWWRHESRL